ncbi:hypothetical protein SUDANB120_00489 [Streptomyces sp. enrichment culture]
MPRNPRRAAAPAMPFPDPLEPLRDRTAHRP